MKTENEIIGREVRIKRSFAVALKTFLSVYGSDDPEALVFRTSTGTPFAYNNFARTVRRVRKKVGMPTFTAHTQRHQYASRLLQAGTPIALVAKYLGDTIATVQAVYLHFVPNDEIEDEAMDALEQATGPVEMESKTSSLPGRRDLTQDLTSSS